MDDEYDILIDDTGVHFVYADALAEIFADESLRTRRVSTVEPATESGVFGNEWVADMTLAGASGVILGPFQTREQALKAERDWLRTEKGL